MAKAKKNKVEGIKFPVEHSLKVDHETFMLIWDVQMLIQRETGKRKSFKGILREVLETAFPQSEYPNFYLFR